MNILLKKNIKENKKNESKSSISINQMGILNSYNMSLLSSKSKGENSFWKTFNKKIENNKEEKINENKIEKTPKIGINNLIDTKIILSNMKTSKKKLFENVSKIENNQSKNSSFINNCTNNINQEILSDFVDFNIENNNINSYNKENNNNNSNLKENITSEKKSINERKEYSLKKIKFENKELNKTKNKFKISSKLKLEKDEIIEMNIEEKYKNEKLKIHIKEIIEKFKEEYKIKEDLNEYKKLINEEIKNNITITLNEMISNSNIFGSQIISQKNISSLYDKRRGLDSFENSQSQSITIMSNLSIKNVFDGKNIINKTSNIINFPDNNIIVEEESNLNITSVNTINLKSTLNDIVDGDLYYNNIQSNLHDIKEIAEENNNDNNELIIQIILDEINKIKIKDEISIVNLSNKLYNENYIRDNIIDNKEKIAKTFYYLLLASQENNIDIIQEINFEKIIKN